MTRIWRPFLSAFALGLCAAPASGQSPLCTDLAAAVAAADTRFQAWGVPAAVPGSVQRVASVRALRGASSCAVTSSEATAEYQCTWSAAATTVPVPDVAAIQACYPSVQPQMDLARGHRAAETLRPTRAVFHQASGVTVTVRLVWSEATGQLVASDVLVAAASR